MCLPAVPSDTPSSRISCNLCHNYQSDANRYGICLSAGDPTNLRMTKRLKLRPICSEETPLSSPGRLQQASRCGAHTRYWFFQVPVWAQRSHSGVGQWEMQVEMGAQRPIHRPDLFFILTGWFTILFFIFFFALCSLNNGVWLFQKNEPVLNGTHESSILFSLSWCEAFSSRWRFFIFFILRMRPGRIMSESKTIKNVSDSVRVRTW